MQYIEKAFVKEFVWILAAISSAVTLCFKREWGENVITVAISRIAVCKIFEYGKTISK